MGSKVQDPENQEAKQQLARAKEMEKQQQKSQEVLLKKMMSPSLNAFKDSLYIYVCEVLAASDIPWASPVRRASGNASAKR